MDDQVSHRREGDALSGWRLGGASLLGSVATLLLACTPPDRPVRLVEPLPEELLAYLDADSTRALFLHEGLSYHFVWSEKGPWAVHVLRVELERCDLGLRVLPAGEVGLHGAGLATVTELVGEAGGGANAEFAPGREAVGIAIGITDRDAEPVRHAIAQVDAAEIEIFGEIRERDHRAAALRIERVEEQIAQRIAGIVGARIGEFPLIRCLALGLGVTAAQIDREIAELHLADELRIVELAFEPRRVLDEVGIAVLEIFAQREGAALQCVADEEIGEAELVLADFQPET